MADLQQQTRRDTAHHILRDTLWAASAERDQRWDTVRTVFGIEPEWSVYERQAMLDKVNELRAGNGLPPVAMSSIELADKLSYGRNWLVDFAGRCAALAVGEDDRG